MKSFLLLYILGSATWLFIEITIIAMAILCKLGLAPYDSSRDSPKNEAFLYIAMLVALASFIGWPLFLTSWPAEAMGVGPSSWRGSRGVPTPLALGVVVPLPYFLWNRALTFLLMACNPMDWRTQSWKFRHPDSKFTHFLDWISSKRRPRDRALTRRRSAKERKSAKKK